MLAISPVVTQCTCQIRDPQLHFGAMSLAHARTPRPYRHFFRAMCRQAPVTPDSACDVVGWVFAAVSLRKRGQIWWGHLQCLGSWAVALSIDTVTGGTVEVYISGPEAGELALTGTYLIPFCWAAPSKAIQAMRPMMGKMLRTSMTTSFRRRKLCAAEEIQSAKYRGTLAVSVTSIIRLRIINGIGRENFTIRSAVVMPITWRDE